MPELRRKANYLPLNRRTARRAHNRPVTRTPEPVMPQTISPSRSLRQALGADALVSGAFGLACVALSYPLAGPLGLPTMFLAGAGAAAILWSIVLTALGRRDRLAVWQVWAVIGLNALWVIESIAILLIGWVAPTPLGIAFVIAQAVVVGVFVEWQIVGLRRSSGAALAAG
jgi:hypothetical protein